MHRLILAPNLAPKTTRRDFLKVVAGAGLILGMRLPLAEATAAGESSVETSNGFQPNAFVRVGEDDTVTVVVKHLEMGQGSHTGLATLVAEELDAAWAQIVTESAPADTERYKNLFWGSQGTGGSSAMANSFRQMRAAGATARKMLVAAAAEKWQVPVGEITVSQGVIRHGEHHAKFGELASLAAKQAVPAPEEIALKDPKDFVLIGRQKLARKDGGKTDGSAKFTQDVQLPGMLTAVVAHPPRFGAKVKSVDATQAKAMANVVDVVQIPSGVAVLAKDFWSASQARDALTVEWDESGAFTLGSEEILAKFKTLAEKPGVVARNDGDCAKAFQNAAKVIEAEYEFPYLAHAAMEPMNCVALVTEQGCEVWNGEQMQTLDQSQIAAAVGVPPAQVKIHMLYAGGSFGRRACPQADYVLEAVHIAKAKPGTPVKLVWTREDDTRGGFYRPMYFHRVRAALDEKGYPLAWEQRIVGQSILDGTPFEPFMVKNGVDKTSVEGASTLPYQIPNLKVDLHSVKLGVPVLWWRSVGHTHTAFSTETFFDRIAKAGGQDPVALRMKLLEGHPRHQGVLKLVAEKAGWDRELPKGWGRGVAVHESFNSFAAQVAEVSLDDNGGFKVERIVCAVDCGLAINPDIIKAQIEGGIGFGLSPVLMSALTLKDGQVVESNFHDYSVLRISQMPKIEVYIVPSVEAPTGVGEPGVPPVAPAVANALSDASGQWFGRLPLKLA